MWTWWPGAGACLYDGPRPVERAGHTPPLHTLMGGGGGGGAERHAGLGERQHAALGFGPTHKSSSWATTASAPRWAARARRPGCPPLTAARRDREGELSGDPRDGKRLSEMAGGEGGRFRGPGAGCRPARAKKPQLSTVQQQARRLRLRSGFGGARRRPFEIDLRRCGLRGRARLVFVGVCVPSGEDAW